jgi:peptide deformylase
MIIPLTTIPSPILYKKAVEVSKIDKDIINLVLNMIDTFKVQDHPKAVGLAANQVGRPEKIFLALIDKKIVPFINPEILEYGPLLVGAGHASPDTKKQKNDDVPLEGCLSIPGYFGEVQRREWVKIKYTTISVGARHASPAIHKNINIVEKTEVFKGFPATIIQHEMDHLEGHVFTEKLLSQNGKLYKVVMGKNSKEEFEEVNI